MFLFVFQFYILWTGNLNFVMVDRLFVFVFIKSIDQWFYEVIVELIENLGNIGLFFWCDTTKDHPFLSLVFISLRYESDDFSKGAQKRAQNQSSEEHNNGHNSEQNFSVFGANSESQGERN